MTFDWSLDIVGIGTLLTLIAIFIWNSVQYKQMKKQLEIENNQLHIQKNKLNIISLLNTQRDIKR